VVGQQSGANASVDAGGARHRTRLVADFLELTIQSLDKIQQRTPAQLGDGVLQYLQPGLVQRLQVPKRAQLQLMMTLPERGAAGFGLAQFQREAQLLTLTFPAQAARILQGSRLAVALQWRTEFFQATLLGHAFGVVLRRAGQGFGEADRDRLSLATEVGEGGALLIQQQFQAFDFIHGGDPAAPRRQLAFAVFGQGGFQLARPRWQRCGAVAKLDQSFFERRGFADKFFGRRQLGLRRLSLTIAERGFRDVLARRLDCGQSGDGRLLRHRRHRRHADQQADEQPDQRAGEA